MARDEELEAQIQKFRRCLAQANRDEPPVRRPQSMADLAHVGRDNGSGQPTWDTVNVSSFYA